MFGLTDSEMENYRNIVQDFAVQELTTHIASSAIFAAPATVKDDVVYYDSSYVQHLVMDIEKIATLVMMDAAYEYADLQCDSELTETEIVGKLDKYYSNQIVVKCFQFGVAFTTEFVDEMIGIMIPELPYLYATAIEDENFDEDDFLEERLDAYNIYLQEMEGEDDDEGLDNF
jgi:hypothetical protein